MPHGDIPDRRFEVGSGIAAVLLLVAVRGPLDPAVTGALAASSPDLEHLFRLPRPGGRKLFPSHRLAPERRSSGADPAPARGFPHRSPSSPQRRSASRCWPMSISRQRAYASPNACSSCGRENAAEARFCDACGASLDTRLPEDATRKTVTVVFTDVTGSTALGERLDPESLRQVMRRYFGTVQVALERHGGTVEKFIGDAAVAVFGVPAVHDDDAMRAVRAVFELREALERLNDELQREHGVRIVTRTGANTGEVVVGGAKSAADQRLATGDAVNVAARLEQAAAPGEVLLGAQSYDAVRDAVVVEAVKPVEARSASRCRPGDSSRSGPTCPPSPGQSGRCSWAGRESSMSCNGRSKRRYERGLACSRPLSAPRESASRASRVSLSAHSRPRRACSPAAAWHTAG
jgi:class 3 adenylate cyclase